VIGRLVLSIQQVPKQYLACSLESSQDFYKVLYVVIFLKYHLCYVLCNKIWIPYSKGPKTVIFILLLVSVYSEILY
jgi:hypothetical protein